jgi:hypothetical protein
MGQTAMSINTEWKIQRRYILNNATKAQRIPLSIVGLRGKEVRKWIF